MRILRRNVKENKMKQHLQVNCPVCASENLGFGKVSFNNDFMFIMVDCLDCGLTGSQHFNLNFIGTSYSSKKNGQLDNFKTVGDYVKGK